MIRYLFPLDCVGDSSDECKRVLNDDPSTFHAVELRINLLRADRSSSSGCGFSIFIRPLFRGRIREHRSRRVVVAVNL